MTEFHWSLVTEEEWQDEVRRRWDHIDREERDPVLDAELHELDDLDRLHDEELRWCE